MHSLRHGYVTMLVRSGANLSTVQRLARHSSPDLTANTYTNLAVHDTAAAVEQLPAFTFDAPNRQAGSLAATGTDGLDDHISNSLSLSCPYGDDGTGRILPHLAAINKTTPMKGVVVTHWIRRP
jgi:hypothetical protein